MAVQVKDVGAHGEQKLPATQVGTLLLNSYSCNILMSKPVSADALTSEQCWYHYY
jgi:hypothetical protein